MAAKKKANSKQGGGATTALYLRVSTDTQFEEGYSIDAQEEKLKQWCKLKDIADFEVYTDGGFSGSNLNRPEMQRLIENIKQHRISRVVVYKLDRLSRSQKDTLYLLEDVFIPYQVDFVSLSENFDTSTPYGKAMIGILSVFAQLERENIRERTRMGMYERVKSGLWMGGCTTPFGYDYDANQNTLVPNQNADDVKRIYDLYIEGYSTTALAKMFPVCSDRQITQILDRVTYMGKINYKGEIIQGIHQAIIDETTWQMAQREREKRSAKSTTSSSYLLTGLVFCGKCGAKMRYQKWGGKKVKLYCYSQQTSKPNLVKDPHCDNYRYEAEQVERIVLEELFSYTEKIRLAERPDAAGQKPRASGVEVLQQKYAQVSSSIKRLYNLYAQSANELLLQTIEESQQELERLGRLLESEKKAVSCVKETEKREAYLSNLRERWNTMSMAEKHKVLRLCIDRISITDGAIDIEFLVK